MSRITNESTPTAASQPVLSNPTGLAKATGLMMAMVLLSRVLGLVRDAIISHYFGRGPQTDAYNAAFTVPDLLFNLLQSGALSSTIVPIITEYRQKGQDHLADRTVSIVASTIFVVIGLLILVMEIYARELTLLLHSGPSFRSASLDIAVPLTRVLLPAQLFFFMGGLMMGVLYSRKKFLIPALGPVIYNAGIIAGGIFLRPILGRILGPARAIEGLVWGAIGGAFLGNFLIPYIAVRRLGVSLKPNFQILDPAAKKVWRLLLPVGLGISLPSIDQLVNKAFASYLPSGDMTALMNAYRLMLVPIGIFAQAQALTVFPNLSGQAADQNVKAMRATLNQSLRNILFLTVPASVLLMVLADPIITFLLQSGKYHLSDTLVTASALKMLSLGIFAWSCQSLLVRGFYALQSARVAVVSGGCVSVIFIAMNWYVVHHTDLGVAGLGLATSIAATIHMVALYILLRKRLMGLNTARLLGSVSKTIAASAAMGAVAWGVNSGLSPVVAGLAPKLGALLILLLGGVGGIGAFAVVAVLLRMPEVAAVRAMVGRKRAA